MLESTEGGSCLNPQKEEAAKVHRRRKLLKSTEGGSCLNPQKEEAARVHKGRKRLIGKCGSGYQANNYTKVTTHMLVMVISFTCKMYLDPI